MEDTLNNAFSEVYDVILHMESDLRNNISPKFIRFIKESRNKEYIVKIDYNQKIKNQISDDAKTIISIIYRNYLVDEETRKKLQKEDEEYFKEKYSYENLFKNSKKEPESSSEPEQNVENILPIEVKKENIFVKLWNFIKLIFRKK